MVIVTASPLALHTPVKKRGYSGYAVTVIFINNLSGYILVTRWLRGYSQKAGKMAKVQRKQSLVGNANPGEIRRRRVG